MRVEGLEKRCKHYLYWFDCEEIYIQLIHTIIFKLQPNSQTIVVTNALTLESL